MPWLAGTNLPATSSCAYVESPPEGFVPQSESSVRAPPSIRQPNMYGTSVGANTSSPAPRKFSGAYALALVSLLGRTRPLPTYRSKAAANSAAAALRCTVLVLGQHRSQAVPHSPHHVARDRVREEEREEDKRRLRGDDRKADHADEDYPQRHPLLPVHFLEAPEGHVEHHGHAGEDSHHPGHGGEPVRLIRHETQVGERPDKADHHRGTRRARHALEVALVDHADVGVEARE